MPESSSESNSNEDYDNQVRLSAQERAKNDKESNIKTDRSPEKLSDEKIQELLDIEIPDKSEGDLSFLGYCEYLKILIPPELSKEELTLHKKKIFELFLPDPKNPEGSKVPFKINFNTWRQDLNETILMSFKGTGSFKAMLEAFREGHKEVVACSAGNHAQGVAYAAALLGMHAHIYMPEGTSKSKIRATKSIGGSYVTIYEEGLNYDECAQEAEAMKQEKNLKFIHPFDNKNVIDGQMLHFYNAWLYMKKIQKKIDFLAVGVGGGGFAAGICQGREILAPKMKMLLVEAEGADSFNQARKSGELVTLPKVDKHAGGAAVARTGRQNFEILNKNLTEKDKNIVVNNGEISDMVDYCLKNLAIQLETAGAMPFAALEKVQKLLESDWIVDDILEAIKNEKYEIDINTVSVNTGGNITPEEQVARSQEALIYREQEVYLEIELPENEPGVLGVLTEYFARQKINITYLDYKTNQIESTEKKPVTKIGLSVEEGNEKALISARKYLKNNEYRVNNVSRNFANQVAQCISETEKEFETQQTAKRPPYDEFKLNLVQSPGSLKTILDKLKKAGKNVERIYYKEDKSTDSNRGEVKIGVSRLKEGSIEEIYKILNGDNQTGELNISSIERVHNASPKKD